MLKIDQLPNPSLNGFGSFLLTGQQRRVDRRD